MFTFRSIELLHWDLWDHVRVPVDGQVVLFTGPNGCGKTTFLDAMRVLLNARRLSTSRRIATYLRGEVKVAVIKGVVTNELRKGTGQRPFTRRGVFDDVATLACVIERSPRGLERRYAILGGDVPVTDLQEVEGWMGPEAYSRALETAGVPRTMLKVLALEQGETHRLARRTPEQLLDYVLEMQGDREVLDRYARAVQHYRSAKAELDELEGSLPAIPGRLFKARGQVIPAQGTRSRRVAMLSGGVMPLMHGPQMDAVTRAAHLSWLPQHGVVTEPLSVLELVTSARFRFQESHADARAAAALALAELDMADFGSRTLAGGGLGEP